MFVFFVLMLWLAVLTDSSNEMITNDSIVESELATENQLTTEAVSDNVFRN